ncbi:hypothetical protein NLJ89_g12337 [Agrocybe chaxingu]|uniref:Uncharacterized protein n=1 Tax=Agrocybe chaxingu TaxID=84603 RepID=A0A9W8JMQ1_9AGAR|nr:hypothetical protein NLJ89_g12337 [Agrocybe chaxingu]
MCLGNEPDISPLLKLDDDPTAPPGSFAWPWKGTFTISRNASPDQKNPSGVLTKRGFTEGDRKFFSATQEAENRLPVQDDDELMDVDTSDDDYDPPTKKKQV